jgi:hypothetical protein
MTADRREEAWDDVLNGYLEGHRLRADAEELLMRQHLAPDERDQIERSLRLADEVTAAVREPTPSAGFEARLIESLRACPAPATMPQGWVESAGGEYVSNRPAPASGDDLVDAALEALAAESDIPAPSPGFQFRLHGGLRAFMESADGAIDESLADRLLGDPRPSDQARWERPDVIAASAEDERPKNNADDDKA